MGSGAKPRLRALLLAAGRGERLRPLTDFLPKPLLPIAGQPVAAHSLQALAAAGCEGAALNLHHLGDSIRRRFGAELAGMPLVYSVEPELLGTLGALAPLRDFLGAADLVLIVNGDSFCRWPLRRLVRRHLSRRPDVTILLSRRAAPDRFGGGVAIDGEGRIVSLRGEPPAGARRRVYAGAHVLERRLLDELPEGPADIVSGLWQPLLAGGGRLETLSTARRWHDLGTPRRYLDAALASAGRPPWRPRGAGGGRVERGARLWRSALQPNARIASGARVEESVLLDGAAVAAGCQVRRSILGPGVELPAGTHVEARLVTTARAGAPPGPHDSLVGGLVYTPI